MSDPIYLEIPPSPPLDRLVQCFWFLRGSLGGAPAETVVPDGRLEIILHLGEPFAELSPAGRATRQAEALVSGQLTGPKRLLPSDAADIVGIRFRPAGARAFLGVPLAELTDRVIPLAEAGVGLSGDLLRAAHGSADPAERARRLAEVLAKRVRITPVPMAAAAATLLSSGRVGIGTVAARLGVTRRTLERQVLAETGLSPKTLQRVLRFRRAFRMLDRTPAGGWSQAAVAAGYYDQAHLIREFREFSGAAPSVFLDSDPELSRALLGGD